MLLALLSAIAAPASSEGLPPSSDVELAFFGCLRADLDIDAVVDDLEALGWLDTPPERLGERAFRALAAKQMVNYVAMQEPNASWAGTWEAQMEMARAHGRRAAMADRRFLTHPRNRSFVDVSSTTYAGETTVRCEIVADPDSLGPAMRGSVLGGPMRPGEPPVAMRNNTDMSTADETVTISSIALDGPTISEATGAPFPFAGIISVWRRAPD